MKKIDPYLLKRVVGNPPPKPFPGVWPTRWFIALVYWDDRRMQGKGKVWRYWGKPNILIGRKLIMILSQRWGKAVIREFDRNGIIGESMVNFPAIKAKPMFASNLLAFYQPWFAGTEVVTCWGRSKEINPWKFIWKGKTWICYTVGPPDVYGREGHLSWLRSQKFDGLA